MKMQYEVFDKNILTDSEFKFYFIGLICADGYISQDSNGISIALKESDHDYLDILRKNITSREMKYDCNRKCHTLYFSSRKVKDEMMRYINTCLKTKNLNFPPNIPDKYIKDFIRGYFDGDGNLSIKMSYRIVKGIDKSYPGLRLRLLGTYPFLLGVSQTFHYKNLVNFDRIPSKKGSENVYYIEYAFSSADRICTWLYKDANFYLPRKKRVFEFISKTDSEKLIENYDTTNGHYNTLASSLRLDEGIVGSD